MYNLNIAKILCDIETAVFFEDLFKVYKRYLEEDDFYELSTKGGDWFIYTVNECTKNTYLTLSKQQRCIRRLLREKFIDYEVVSVPREDQSDLPGIRSRVFKMNEKGVKLYSFPEQVLQLYEGLSQRPVF